MSRLQPPASASSAADVADETPAPALTLLELGEETPSLPEECAGCGGLAIATQAVGRGPRSLLVPYCGICLRRASAARTRELATASASVLLAASLVAGLPLLSPWTGVVTLTLAGAIGSVLPLLASHWLLPRVLPRLAGRRAAFWAGARVLALRRESFAAHLTALNPGVRARGGDRREPLPSLYLLGPILALVAGPVLHRVHHPLVRMLNLGANEATLEVDGRVVSRILGSSRENPAAGAELRLPAGRRYLVARTREGLLDERSVVLRSGRHHLYAPGDHGQCFWLETTTYGRSQPPLVQRSPLPARAPFWILPPSIDGWFAPSPPPSPSSRSSGGSRTALRQGRCRDAPANPARGP